MFTPFKAATALARARQATEAGQASCGHLLARERRPRLCRNQPCDVSGGAGLKKLVYAEAPPTPRPVGGVVLDESITPLVEQAWELLGSSDAMDALAAAYKPGRTFAQAFAEFYAKVFAAQGLLVLDASGREFHRMGAPVLRAALEARRRAARGAGGAQPGAGGGGLSRAGGGGAAIEPAVSDRREHGARLALKRTAPSAAEPDGLWQAGRQKYSTADLVGILDAEPERISPSALLRPVFQDFLLSTSLDHRRAGGDCLLCAVGGAVRADSGTHDAGRSRAFRQR